MDDRNSLGSLAGQIKTFLDVAGNAIVFVVGNKVDVDGAQIAKEDATKFAGEHGFPVFFTSAKTGEGVKEVFRALGEELVKVKVLKKSRKLEEVPGQQSQCC
jgi:Fe2+ transport system protein B